MTADDQTSHDRAPKKQAAPRDNAGKGEHAKPEQGVVKDDRGQEQPKDKNRAAQNR